MVSVTLRHTFCAVVVVSAPSTPKRRLALLAVPLAPRSESVSVKRLIVLFVLTHTNEWTNDGARKI